MLEQTYHHYCLQVVKTTSNMTIVIIVTVAITLVVLLVAGVIFVQCWTKVCESRAGNGRCGLHSPYSTHQLL
jgi:hypothetical protein